MNGTYQPLINYVSDEQSKKLNQLLDKQKEEIEFRIKNFFDKYSDNFINQLITNIKECDINTVLTVPTWNFAYQILGSDIKILDPNSPENAARIIGIFFKVCCENLELEYEKFELESQIEDKLEFTVIVKNPLNKLDDKKIYELMKKL